jgi:hypothetical protein
MTVHTSDAFTRTGDLSGTSTDVALGGTAKAWITSGSAKWDTFSGAVYYRSVANTEIDRLAYVDLGIGGGYRVEATIGHLQYISGRFMGIVACHLDITRYYVVGVFTGSGGLHLRKMTPAGGQSPIIAESDTNDLLAEAWHRDYDPSVDVVVGDTIGFQVVGDDLTVLYNGREWARVTDRGTTYASSKAGFYGGEPTTDIGMSTFVVSDPILPQVLPTVDPAVTVAVAIGEPEILNGPPPDTDDGGGVDELIATALYYYASVAGPPLFDLSRMFGLTGIGQLAQMGRPLVVRVGDEPGEITAFLYHRPEINTPVADLVDALGHTFQSRHKEIGTGEITLMNDDPDLDQVWDRQCVVRYEIFGRAAFTMIVDEVNHVAIAEGEEHDQRTQLSGKAHISCLQESVVYPPTGPDVLPFSDDRIFSWPSPDYNDSWWTGATALVTQNPGALEFPPDAWVEPLVDESGAGGSYWEWAISDDWPDPGAWWIWAHLPNPREIAPEGTCYFRRKFEVPFHSSIARLQLYAILDDGGDVWLDGQVVMSATYGAEPTGVYSTDVDITPGEHTLAIECRNDPPDPDRPTWHNPGGVLFTCYAVDINGEFVTDISDPIVHSDDSWVGVFYPPQPPGMTCGEVIRHVIQEGQSRGCFPEITLGFDDVFDSGGNAWPITGDISTKISTSVWVFVGEELASTYCDIWMGPGDFMLYAWVHERRGADRPVTAAGVADEADPTSGNLRGLKHHTVQ